MQGTKRDYGGKNRAPEPNSLEEICNIGTMPRVGDLSGQWRCCSLSEAESNAEHDPGSEESPWSCRTSLDDGGSKHEGGSDCYSRLAANPVANERGRDKGGKTPQAYTRQYKTQY